MTDKTLLTVNFLLGLCVILLAFAYHMQNERIGFFAQVPVDQLHTMRVWEDGSYEIEYQDNTSEVGCLPEGLCND